METYLNNFDQLFIQIKLSEGKLDNDLIACMFLLTLPESFDMVTITIKILSLDKITLDSVKSRFLDEEIRPDLQQGEITQV